MKWEKFYSFREILSAVVGFVLIGLLVIAALVAAVWSLARRERKLNRPPNERTPDPTQPPSDWMDINF